MRTHTVRRQKSRKIFGVFFKIAALITLLSATYFGGACLLDKFFFKNRDYTIQKIEASLDDVLTLPELKRAIGLQEGMNIFSFHLGRAEEILSALPEVKKAHIERLLPTTIQITLERRIPILRLVASSEDAFVPGQSLVIDEEGVLLSPAKLNAALLELPTLEGLSLGEIHLGQPLKNEKMPFVIALWKRINNSGNTLLTIRSIDFSRDYWAVVTDVNKTRYIFGEEDLSAQCERLQKLLSYCQENRRELESVNLILEHNTPVTFRPNAEVVSFAERGRDNS
jgi:cell division septal protein FtsQ